MNKTVNVNLAGRFFHIDENAYRILETYLKKLKKAFEQTQGASEIIEDIEARMAELFEERKTHPQDVIGEKDVAAVIEILGEPADFQDEAESAENQTTPKKKLFRDPDDRYIGGVAAGLGHFFGFETFWIRLIWLLLILFSGGTFLVLYLIFWILLPSAKTTAEKLQMKGEPVNISTIEKKIREEFEEVTQKVKDVDFKKGTEDLKKKSKSAVDGFGNALKGLLKFVGFFLGVILILISINMLLGLLIGGTGILLLGWTFGPFLMLQSFLSTFIPIWGLVVLAFIIALIPAFFLLGVGFKLLRPQKSIFSPLFIWIGVFIWFASVVVLAGVGFHQIRVNRVQTSYTQKSPVLLQPTDTLQLRIKDIQSSYERIVDWGNSLEVYTNEAGENFFLSDDWRLVIQPDLNQKSGLELQFRARGKNRNQAQIHAKEIIFEPVITNQSIAFPSHWIRKQAAKYHDRDLRTYLNLPVGQLFYIHPNMATYMSWETPNQESFSRKELAGHLWKMEIDGLRCMDCIAEATTRELYYHNSKSGTEIHIRK